MRVKEQIDGLLLLYTTLLFFLVFGFIDLTLPTFQAAEYLNHVGPRISLKYMTINQLEVYKRITGVDSEEELVNTTIFDQDLRGFAFLSLACALTLNNSILQIYFSSGIAIVVLVTGYLYALKGKMRDDLESDDLSFRQYLKFLGFPFVVCVIASGSLYSLNIIWPYCYAGTEQALAFVILGFFVFTAFLPTLSKFLRRFGFFEGMIGGRSGDDASTVEVNSSLISQKETSPLLDSRSDPAM
jgi:hypothetical protein